MALKRPVHPIPDDVRQALDNSGLWDAYSARPAYQRNDYIGWIGEARREVTRRKRIRQMLDELEAGEGYMGLEWKGQR